MADPTNTAADVTLDDIEAARRRLRGAIIETDCDWSRTLSEIAGCKLWL
jgi:threonine dehydratase